MQRSFVATTVRARGNPFMNNGLLFWPSAADRLQCLAALPTFGSIADHDLSVAQSLYAVLGRDCTSSGCAAASATSEYVAVECGSQAAAGKTVARLSSRVRLRNRLVC